MTTIHTRQLQQYTQDNYNNTHKTTTTIHTRQLQKYTQDNYNNTHKTTTTIHTRQLQQYTQDNYNSTHKTTTTVHTRQLQQYTQDNYNNTHKTTTTIHTRQLQQYTKDMCVCVFIVAYYHIISSIESSSFCWLTKDKQLCKGITVLTQHYSQIHINISTTCFGHNGHRPVGYSIRGKNYII